MYSNRSVTPHSFNGEIMKLYYAPDTCSLSPHIVLRELAIEFELVKVDNRSKLTADGRDFLTINTRDPHLFLTANCPKRSNPFFVRSCSGGSVFFRRRFPQTLI